MRSVMEMNQLTDNWEINAACNWVIHLKYIFLSQSVFIFLPSERLLCHHFLGGSVCKGQKTKTKAQGGGKGFLGRITDTYYSKALCSIRKNLRQKKEENKCIFVFFFYLSTCRGFSLPTFNFKRYQACVRRRHCFLLILSQVGFQVWSA